VASLVPEPRQAGSRESAREAAFGFEDTEGGSADSARDVAPQNVASEGSLELRRIWCGAWRA
jgi:hypothetical protein